MIQFIENFSNNWNVIIIIEMQQMIETKIQIVRVIKYILLFLMMLL